VAIGSFYACHRISGGHKSHVAFWSGLNVTVNENARIEQALGVECFLRGALLACADEVIE
jgi:hypothetical protein